MKLRIAKKIFFATDCINFCGHNWHSIEKANVKVSRAAKRGSRLISFQRYFYGNLESLKFPRF